MSQIVSAKKTKEGTYVLEVKPLNKERISESELTVQTHGTNGWGERLPGCFEPDEEGKLSPLTAIVQIRRKNKNCKKNQKPER